MQCANVGARAAAPGRPKQGQPPRGAESYAKRTNVGATFPPGRPKQGQPPRGAESYAKRTNVGATSHRHDVLFFASDKLVDIGNETVSELLDVVL